MTELKEIKSNLIDKLPKIMEYSLGNFGQLSSIDKLININDILNRIKRYWDNGILFADDKNEFAQFGGAVLDFDNLLFEVNILNDDINKLFDEVEQVFFPTLEMRKNNVVNKSKDVIIAEIKTMPEQEGW